jgi:hypothetical protein
MAVRRFRTRWSIGASLLAVCFSMLHGCASSRVLKRPLPATQADVGWTATSPEGLTVVTFWTTPDGGGPGVDTAYPFAIEDYLPPPD